MSESESDNLKVRPLGAGQEVGRSCIHLSFRGKNILLDMGIHPGRYGINSLPFVDLIDVNDINLLLVTHFHLDHCGALPWFLCHTNFKGRIFMTHATKAIFRWILTDYLRVSRGHSNEKPLFNEKDLLSCMNRIETVDFHEESEVEGIRFIPYTAGHVLGAAMFSIEIAGVRVLYTGDFSCEEDRHLCSAEIPPLRPDVVIMEATYGTRNHDDRESREKRFTSVVHKTVAKGGKCLIPCFALGRAQELQLILDEYWSVHEDLQQIPVYYASALATKCLGVYRTFMGSMNKDIKRRAALQNPFNFRYITAIRGRDEIEDGPCVVLASPGMLQSGLSQLYSRDGLAIARIVA